MDVSVILIVVVALAIGLALGWALGGRRGSALAVEAAGLRERVIAADALRDTLQRVEIELSEARSERGRLESEHAGLRAQHDLLVPTRDTLARERDHHQGECGRLTTELEAMRVRMEEQAAANARERAQLQDEFRRVAQATLDEAQAKFLTRADERFKESEATARQSLSTLLQPVHERLAKYEDAVGKVEAERREAFGVLANQIETMRVDAKAVSSQASNLVNALRNAPKARGRWGEQQLKNVLESCGLSEHTDFQTEVSVEVEGGRLRPDAIVRIPGGKALVIDAKVSLNAYQDAFNAVDEEGRQLGLAAHAASMRNHVKSLGDKAYWNQFDDAPDYVIMFVPGEHFLSAALEHDPTLWDFAFDKRVLLATPTNLVAIARTVAAVWRQEKLAKEAAAIGRLGKDLYDQLAVVGEHLGKAGSSLNQAVGHFNKATTSFNGRLVTRGKRFRELNIESSGKEVDDLPAIEAQATHVAGEPPALALVAPANDEPEAATA